MALRLKRLLRTLLACALDCALLLTAIAAAIVLNNYFLKVNQGFLPIYIRSGGLICLSCAASFIFFGIYEDLWSYVSMTSLVKLSAASLFASFGGYCAMRMIAGFWLSPIIGVTSFYLFLTMVAAMRVLPSLWSAMRRRVFAALVRNNSRIPLLIVGAGEAAAALIKDYQIKGMECPYKIVGLVDDDERKYHQTLRGVKVLGATEDIFNIARRYGVQEIIVAIPSATTSQRKKILSACAATGCKLRMMSAVSEIAEAKAARMRDMNITDLLGRREAHLSQDAIAAYITDQTVLVTGGGGSIGSELCRQIMRFNPSCLVVLDRYENSTYLLARELEAAYRDRPAGRFEVRIGSVLDEKRLDDVFAEFKPAAVFHAAAYKHVPLMEECPALAVENNVFGSHAVARAALRHGVKKLVMISTDKAVNPTNVMGATKRIAELMFQSMNGQATEFVTVRFGNVLDSGGSVVQIFKHQIEAGGPVTVTHPEIIRYFMTISEAAQLVLEAGAMARGGETFVLDMGEPVKMVDLANAMIEMAGLIPNEDIKVEFSGLRPGEKLYEELLTAEEGIKKTAHDKIFVARSEVIDAAEREHMLEMLAACLKDDGDVRACLSALLPSYRPFGAEGGR